MSNATAIPKENNVQVGTAKIIPFRKEELLLVDNSGEPFVPMKPVVEGMGLAWQTQHRKLHGGRFASCITEMVIQVPGDVQARTYSCLPLKKLPGWLMSIHPGKVREELKDGIIAYQNECDDVLWAYWNDGLAVRAHSRDAMTVLDELIGMSEVNVIKGLIRDKAKVIPIGRRRGFQLAMHNRLHTRFNVPRVELIPAQQFEAACNFVAAYAIEGEWLPKQAGIQVEAGPRRRYLISFNYKCEQQVTPVANDACVMTHRELIQAMVTPGELPVSTDELYEFTMAALTSLRARNERAGRPGQGWA